METQAKRNPLMALVNYLREAKEELGKVTWPSRGDAVRYAALVIGASIVMAVVFAALDLGLTLGLEKLITLKP